MAGPKPMDHLPVFEKLGEEQVRLQFSQLDNDVGREARAWLHGISEEREKSRHAELLAEIKRPHWSVTPSFYLLVLSVLLSAASVFVAVTQQPQAQSPTATVAPSKQTVLTAPDSSSTSPIQLPPASPLSPAPPKK